MPKMIFTFASNEGGLHGAGAAKTAYEKYGARWGKSYGHYGDSFAIPTKNELVETIADVTRIYGYINGFIAYAKGHRKMIFQVTRIGCGLAGFTDAQIAPMFIGSPKNCHFDEKWRQYLGDGYNYWGTHSE